MSMLQVVEFFVHSIEFLNRGSDHVQVGMRPVQVHEPVSLCPQRLTEYPNANDAFDDELGLLEIQLFAKEETFLAMFAILRVSKYLRTPRVDELARPFRLTFHAVCVVVSREQICLRTPATTLVITFRARQFSVKSRVVLFTANIASSLHFLIINFFL